MTGAVVRGGGGIRAVCEAAGEYEATLLSAAVDIIEGAVLGDVPSTQSVMACHSDSGICR